MHSPSPLWKAAIEDGSGDGLTGFQPARGQKASEIDRFIRRQVLLMVCVVQDSSGLSSGLTRVKFVRARSHTTHETFKAAADA